MAEESDESALWKSWFAAAARADIDRELRHLYGQLDTAVASRSPRCDLSGRCCKFDSYGHRLYVTGLEVAWVLLQIDPETATRVTAIDHRTVDGCPFQVGKLCAIHTIRPLGCRIFFCDPSAEVWMADLYERYQSQIKMLHDRRAVPYGYMEWRIGLAAALGRGNCQAIVR